MLVYKADSADLCGANLFDTLLIRLVGSFNRAPQFNDSFYAPKPVRRSKMLPHLHLLSKLVLKFGERRLRLECGYYE